MKVVHVHRIGGIGGSERHVLTLLRALAARGVDVAFVGLDDPAGAPEPFYAELAAAGTPCERLSCPRDLDPALAVRLARLLRAWRADLVHTHLVHADVYAALVPGLRLVSTKHNADPFRTGVFRHLERAITRRSRRVIAISDAVRRFCVERVGLPGEKLEVVHYGLDELPRPWAENPPLPIAEDARVLLAVCRLAPQKGLETAIRALPTIRASEPRALLLVLGDGPSRGAIERLAAELGVGGAVVLPGRVGDVADWYRRCELLLHPARWEGFGLAVLEAMLARKAVVASRAGSLPELVEDGRTGLLVPVDDPDALAAAVSSLLADPARCLALGRAGAERARAELSVERMVDRTLAVYERALA